MVAAADGSPTLMSAVTRGRYGVLAVFDGELAREDTAHAGLVEVGEHGARDGVGDGAALVRRAVVDCLGHPQVDRKSVV